MTMKMPDAGRIELYRRTFLGRGFAALGSIALNGMFRGSLRAAPADGPVSRGVINPLHFPPKAKRVIWLYQAGGPSHLETFDSKPQLAKQNGKPMPESFTKGQPIAQLQGAKLNCFAPQFGFKRFGKSGGNLRALPAHRLDRRRDLHRPLDDHG